MNKTRMRYELAAADHSRRVDGAKETHMRAGGDPDLQIAGASSILEIRYNEKNTIH